MAIYLMEILNSLKSNCFWNIKAGNSNQIGTFSAVTPEVQRTV